MAIKKTRLSALVAATAAAAMVLSACQSGDSGSAGGGEGGGDQPELPNVDMTKAEADEVQDGGELTLPLTEWPGNFNISQADGALVDVNDMYGPTVSGGIKLDAEGKAEANPDYIESMELTGDNPTTVKLKYNKDAVWDDGTPIDGEDLKAFWEATNGKKEDYQVASTQGWESIKSVEVGSDKKEVTLTYDGVFGDWQNYVFPLLPNEVSSDAKKFNEGFKDEFVPASGPFKATKLDKSAKTVTMEPNDKWWGDKPKLDKITYRVVSQPQQGQAFANKEIDLVNIGTDGDAYETAKNRGDAKIYKSTGLMYTHLTMNATRPGLKDEKVREAIGMAVNRDVIGQAAVGPVEAPVINVNNYTFMPGQDGYQDNTDGWAQHKPEDAEKILQDAGYEKNDDGVYEKDGEKLEFSVVVPADTASNEKRAKQVMNDLNKIGMKVKLDTVPADKYFTDYVTPKNFDMVTFSWQGTPFPITTTANLFYPAESQQNYFGISNEDIGKAVKASQNEADPDKRLELANEMDKQFWAEKVMIPFYATPTVHGVSEDVVNLGSAQFETTDWTIVGHKK